MTVAERFKALEPAEQDALYRASELGGDPITVLDVAFELAWPNDRERADSLRARSILHRLERLGALGRITLMCRGMPMRRPAAWRLTPAWKAEIARRRRNGNSH